MNEPTRGAEHVVAHDFIFLSPQVKQCDLCGVKQPVLGMPDEEWARAFAEKLEKAIKKKKIFPYWR